MAISRNDLKGSAVRLLKVAVTISLLGFLSSKVDWAVFAAIWSTVNPAWILAALMVGGSAQFVSSVRWWYLLKVQTIDIALASAFSLILISQFFNLFMPGAVGGDVIKTIYAVRYAPSKKTYVALSVLMDRLVGIVVMAIGALISIVAQLSNLSASSELMGISYWLLAMLGAVVFGVGLLALTPPDFFRRVCPSLWERIPNRHIIELLIKGFHQHGRALKDSLLAGAYGIVTYILVCAVGILLGLAMDLQLDSLSLVLILTIAIFVATVPISIGGHGVREGAFVVLFGLFGKTSGQGVGIGKEQAIVYSVLFFLAFAVWGILGGWLYIAKSPKASPGECDVDG
ncbi:lysylphosphatidylglycerol synthase transmembrane domain-containing protein [Methyloterricola oryzae]|uniref:lysylphosphatidylglycerol synthase transmembrane domain-containing protein n=1 Tax=Methyloterricola oryzae TaxID=1495050 RepID=UPI0005EB7373|nr:lysylphosphatidylglycerol synthase transmembrane domain-containing protein [Methyloterricola oryzae]